MRFAAGQTGRWLTRVLVAAVTAYAAATVLRSQDVDGSRRVKLVQTHALRGFSETLREAQAEARPRFTLVYFGDSLALPGNILDSTGAAPMQLRRELGTVMRSTGAGEPADLRLVPITYSGLSVWSLYYMADSIADLSPDLVVVEFNLYNFADFWRKQDRAILAAMLPLSRIPETLSLPLSEAGLVMDEWMFSRLILSLGALPWWEAVQYEQVNAADAYATLGDNSQRVVGASKLEFRESNYFLQMAETKNPTTNRSTQAYARMLLGKSLTGVGPDDPALRILAAALGRLTAGGSRVVVYIPPYNMDHLTGLGVVQGSRLNETIGRVREVAEGGGASFVDAHALLDDRHFRDAMDHLSENSSSDGHRALARKLAAAMAGDWQNVLAPYR